MTLATFPQFFEKSSAALASSGAQPDQRASDAWDDVDADFVVEERLYDEIFRLRRRLWIERAGALVGAFAMGLLSFGYF